MHDTNKLSGKIRSPEHCDARKGGRVCHIKTKLNIMKLCLSFKVSLIIQFIQSWKQREFIYFVKA